MAERYPFNLNTELHFHEDRLCDDGWVERTEVIHTLSDGTEITAEDAVVMMYERCQRAAAAAIPTTATAKRTEDAVPRQKTRREREQHLLAYLRKHKEDPDAANIRDAACETGIPRSTLGNLPMWKAFIAWRNSMQPSDVRTTPLTEEMLAVMMDRSSTSNDPADIAAEKEAELAFLIEEQDYDDSSDRR
ncbi:MAG: hypothetical protein K8U57_01785 [Planctomycetes bacterium]|nr:hypothetical protein [Planctomycetota bacterium]